MLKCRFWRLCQQPAGAGVGPDRKPLAQEGDSPASGDAIRLKRHLDELHHVALEFRRGARDPARFDEPETLVHGDCASVKGSDLEPEVRHAPLSAREGQAGADEPLTERKTGERRRQSETDRASPTRPPAFTSVT